MHRTGLALTVLGAVTTQTQAEWGGFGWGDDPADAADAFDDGIFHIKTSHFFATFSPRTGECLCNFG